MMNQPTPNEITIAQACLKEANGDANAAIDLIREHANNDPAFYDGLAAHGAWWAIEAIQAVDAKRARIMPLEKWMNEHGIGFMRVNRPSMIPTTYFNEAKASGLYDRAFDSVYRLAMDAHAQLLKAKFTASDLRDDIAGSKIAKAKRSLKALFEEVDQALNALRAIGLAQMAVGRMGSMANSTAESMPTQQ